MAGGQQPLGSARCAAHCPRPAPGGHRVAPAGRLHQLPTGAADSCQRHRPRSGPRCAGRRTGHHRHGTVAPAGPAAALRLPLSAARQASGIGPGGSSAGAPAGPWFRSLRRERSGLALVLPLAWHPRNRNALIVWDLAVAPDMLQELSPEQLRQRLYTRTEELAPGEQRPGLKLVHINKCPVLAEARVLRPVDIERLQLDMPLLLSRAEQLGQWREGLKGRLDTIYSEQPGPAEPDVEAETLLYDGFMSDR